MLETAPLDIPAGSVIYRIKENKAKMNVITVKDIQPTHKKLLELTVQIYLKKNLTSKCTLPAASVNDSCTLGMLVCTLKKSLWKAGLESEFMS